MKKISVTKRKMALRKDRVKARIYKGGINRPRLCVSKTNKHIFLQIIDDLKGITLVSLSDKGLKGKRMEKAKEMGSAIAKKALTADIKKIVFDRNKYSYHGIVKSIAEGAREGGLEF